MLFLILSLLLSTPLLNTPISIGFSLFLISFSMAITINLFTLSWFSFIIFLIYVGGILIIFAYFSTLRPNQFIFIESYLIRVIGVFFIFTITHPNLPLPSLALPSNSLQEIILIIQTPQFFIYLLIAICLFLVLLVVVKITGINAIPIRPLN